VTAWSEDVTLGGRVTVRDVLFDAEHRLNAVRIPSPNVDAAELVAFALGTTRNRLFLQDPVTPDQKVRVEQLLARRLSRVPLQHILGTTGFRHIEVAVGPGVFIPRPETELVTEAGIRELALQAADDRIAVDLCAGSGAIAICLAMETTDSSVYAVELSDDAIGWTRRNVQTYQDAIDAKGSLVEVVHADATKVAEVGHELAGLAGRVAVVVTNPPYIPDAMIPREPEVRDHEPGMALYGGADGLDVVRGILRTAAILLKPGGLLAIEHADVQGKEAGVLGVPGLLADFRVDDRLAARIELASGRQVFTSIADRIDLNGLPRFTLCSRASG
jgi:release factor glutamine methyltransferase